MFHLGVASGSSFIFYLMPALLPGTFLLRGSCTAPFGCWSLWNVTSILLTGLHCILIQANIWEYRSEHVIYSILHYSQKHGSKVESYWINLHADRCPNMHANPVKSQPKPRNSPMSRKQRATNTPKHTRIKTRFWMQKGYSEKHIPFCWRTYTGWYICDTAKTYVCLSCYRNMVMQHSATYGERCFSKTFCIARGCKFHQSIFKALRGPVIW